MKINLLKKSVLCNLFSYFCSFSAVVSYFFFPLFSGLSIKSNEKVVKIGSLIFILKNGLAPFFVRIGSIAYEYK